MNDIVVSIICNTYNHEKYIQKALQSFVMQKTNFPFEILVHDDASIDNTAQIIRNYEKKYPDLVLPIYQTENQYSKGGKVGKIQRERARGKYIAYCEGDDYWLDPYKLQKQVDALEKHPEVDMCAHGAVKIRDEKQIGFIHPQKETGVISIEKVIQGGGGFFATNSLMCRRTIFEHNYKFASIVMYDYVLQILGALRGGIFYISEDMSAYRVAVSGSWTERTKADKEKLKKHLEQTRQILLVFNDETHGRYDKAIQIRLQRNEFEALHASDQLKALFKPQYKDYVKLLPKNRVIKILVKTIIGRK